MVVINGEKYENPKNIENLCKQFNLNVQAIVIYINGKLITKNKWNKIKIKDNDIIEILTFVGGG
ncbi:MAG: sulfur carrier protein ThiS [Bacteroidales bacterium]|nr:sulfur carrier protein ThiS [Bacteroidales bacterium]